MCCIVPVQSFLSQWRISRQNSNVWGPTSEALRRGDFVTADAEKAIIEQAQRNRLREVLGLVQFREYIVTTVQISEMEFMKRFAVALAEEDHHTPLDRDPPPVLQPHQCVHDARRKTESGDRQYSPKRGIKSMSSHGYFYLSCEEQFSRDSSHSETIDSDVVVRKTSSVSPIPRRPSYSPFVDIEAEERSRTKTARKKRKGTQRKPGVPQDETENGDIANERGLEKEDADTTPEFSLPACHSDEDDDVHEQYVEDTFPNQSYWQDPQHISFHIHDSAVLLLRNAF